MKNSILTIGTFDGVHLGHRKIIRDVVDRAKKTGCESAAITFSVPPRLYFFPSNEPALLTTVTEKKELLKSCGIDKVHVLDFDENLARLSAADFFKKFVIKKCRAQEIIVGYNFGFGHNREGDARFLEKAGAENGIRVKIFPAVVSKSVPISSGRIRDALKEGNLKLANSLLGEPYRVSGKVVHGQHLGSRLGFPTANLDIDKNKIVPLGVYAVQAGLTGKKIYKGMANVGFRPTVTGSGLKVKSVEIHLFNFSGNLYGKTLRVRFIAKIREERAFPSLDELRGQLKKDRMNAQARLKSS